MDKSPANNPEKTPQKRKQPDHAPSPHKVAREMERILRNPANHTDS